MIACPNSLKSSEANGLETDERKMNVYAKINLFLVPTVFNTQYVFVIDFESPTQSNFDKIMTIKSYVDHNAYESIEGGDIGL